MSEIFQIGEHRVKHGSISEGIDDLMDGAKADLIYSDPPWGAGNMKYWQTINKRHTGTIPESISYAEYLDFLFSSITHSSHEQTIVFMEYGQSWRDEFIHKAAGYGLISQGVFSLLYKSGAKHLPCDLHIFAFQKVTFPALYREGVVHTVGFNSLKMALAPFAESGKIILDPCCGMGFTAKAALDADMVFYGNELNMTRLQKTIDRLEKAVG